MQRISIPFQIVLLCSQRKNDRKDGSNVTAFELTVARLINPIYERSGQWRAAVERSPDYLGNTACETAKQTNQTCHTSMFLLATFFTTAGKSSEAFFPLAISCKQNTKECLYWHFTLSPFVRDSCPHQLVACTSNARVLW